MTELWPAPRKLAGAALVLLLHLLAILALISATRWYAQKAEGGREIILHLIAPPKPQTSQTALAKPEKKIPLPKIVREPVPATTINTPLPQIPTAPSLNSLNQQLFGCTPDALASATPEQRSACASASLGPRFDPHAMDYRDHTDRSKSAAQWARDRARKNGPLLLPCMSPQGWSPLYTAMCLAKTAVTGKLEGESQYGYQDVPQSVPNEGDTRMAPVPH
jgi:hypothetical protein